MCAARGREARAHPAGPLVARHGIRKRELAREPAIHARAAESANVPPVHSSHCLGCSEARPQHRSKSRGGDGAALALRAVHENGPPTAHWCTERSNGGRNPLEQLLVWLVERGGDLKAVPVAAVSRSGTCESDAQGPLDAVRAEPVHIPGGNSVSYV